MDRQAIALDPCPPAAGVRIDELAPLPLTCPETPLCLIVVPTFRCPLRCQHCDLWTLQSPELPPALWRRRLSELARVVPRPFLVGLSGGEPLLYPGIFSVLEGCAEEGLLTALATSTQPLSAPRDQRLLDSGLNSLVVSLDGIGPGHDILRRRPGLFERVWNRMRWVKEQRPTLNLSVVTTVYRDNVTQLVSMAEWVYGLPTLIDGLCFHTLSGNLGGPLEMDAEWFRKSPLWPGNRPELGPELDRLVRLRDEGAPLVNASDELREMKRFYAKPDEPLRPCDQYASGMLLLPDGTVKLCPLQDPIGSIVERSIMDLWQDEKTKTLRRLMATCRRNCHFLTNHAYQRHRVR